MQANEFKPVVGAESDPQADFNAVLVAYGFVAVIWFLFIGLMYKKLQKDRLQAERLLQSSQQLKRD